MLVQRSCTTVPDHDAFVAHVMMRNADFGIGAMWSRGLVTDWGLQAPLVRYIARQTRAQISILLAGHGYFASHSLVPGDVIESDQLLHGDEGYAGSPCEVLIVDWDEGSALGAPFRGPPRRSRISPPDVRRLRGLFARVQIDPPADWAAALIADLRALGLPTPHRDRVRAVAPSHVAKLYAALGTARSQLHQQPALPEIAEDLGLCERQVRRCWSELGRDFGLTSDSWRDFLGDSRIAYAQQLLSIPSLPLARVASLSGFRSTIALCHAFSQRGDTTPGELARAIRERWA